MTDLEMTRLCAEAMDIDIFNPQALEPAYQIRCGEEHATWYDPLHDDAQVMALVKKFRLELHTPMTIDGYWVTQGLDRMTVGGTDGALEKDLNRAIVEYIAKIQLEKQK